MAWERIEQLTVSLYDNSNQLIDPADYGSLGFSLSLGDTGLVTFTWSDPAAAEGVTVVCTPTTSLAGSSARINVVDALVEGAVGGGGVAGDMAPQFGTVSGSALSILPAVFPGVITSGGSEDATGIDPNPWVFADPPSPGHSHVFLTGQVLGMSVYPSTGA